MGDDNGRAHHYCSWTALPRYRERIRPVPSASQFCELGRGCGEIVSRAFLRRGSRRRRDTCPFPITTLFVMAADETKQSTLAHVAMQ